MIGAALLAALAIFAKTEKNMNDHVNTNGEPRMIVDAEYIIENSDGRLLKSISKASKKNYEFKIKNHDPYLSVSSEKFSDPAKSIEEPSGAVQNKVRKYTEVHNGEELEFTSDMTVEEYTKKIAVAYNLSEAEEKIVVEAQIEAAQELVDAILENQQNLEGEDFSGINEAYEEWFQLGLDEGFENI